MPMELDRTKAITGHLISAPASCPNIHEPKRSLVSGHVNWTPASLPQTGGPNPSAKRKISQLRIIEAKEGHVNNDGLSATVNADSRAATHNTSMAMPTATAAK